MKIVWTNDNFFKEFWWKAALQGGWETLMWHRPLGSSAVGCSSRADAVVNLLLHTLQQWLAMLFSELDNPQNCPFPWLIWTPSNPWFLGPTQVTHPNGISIGSAVFAGLMNVTNRQTDTDRPCYCICSNRPHLTVAAMQPKNCASSLSVMVCSLDDWLLWIVICSFLLILNVVHRDEGPVSCRTLDVSFRYASDSDVSLLLHHHIWKPCSNSCTDRDTIWVGDSLGEPKEQCIRWGPWSPRGRGNFEGKKWRPIVKYMDTVWWAVQKQVNGLTYHLGQRLGWARGTTY